MLEELEDLLEQIGVHLTSNIKNDIWFQLANSTIISKHFCFISDYKSGSVLCHGMNVHLVNSTFPFTQHAEVGAVIKWYGHRNFRKHNKIVLTVVKLSKIGRVSNSRCCLHCMRFLRRNYENLGLRMIYYSTPDKMQLLRKQDLKDTEFHPSGGYQHAIR